MEQGCQIEREMAPVGLMLTAIVALKFGFGALLLFELLFESRRKTDYPSRR